MATVVPTVLAATASDYRLMMEHATSVNKRVHIDISDGIFSDATTISVAQAVVDEELEVDLHLMLEQPAEQLETALALNPSLIIFHAESKGDIAAAIAHTRELGTKAGVAILPETSVADAADLIRLADHALIFTGHLGHNGGAFQTDQLTKVEEIRKMKPEIEISVDGGVNDTNAALIVLQGVDVLYVGSFLQEADDPLAAYELINKQVVVS